MIDRSRFDFFSRILDAFQELKAEGVVQSSNRTRDFACNPVVKTALPTQGSRELRSHMPCSAAKIKVNRKDPTPFLKIEI